MKRSQIITGSFSTIIRWDALLVALFVSVSVTAQDYTYTTNDGTITITKYIGSGGEVAIPSTIDALPVTIIGDLSFRNCASLTSVTMPNSITTIGEGAFHGCESLTNVAIGSGVLTIGAGAFYLCTNLTNIKIPDSVVSIEGKSSPLANSWGAFSICTSLTNVTLGSSVTNIGRWAFSECFSLTRITIPNSVTKIGDYAFFSCRSLTNVIINNSVAAIGAFAFETCFKLGSITFGNHVTSIGDFAFNLCTSLGSVTLPTSVTNIGEWPFRRCIGLTNVTIPESLAGVAEAAFRGCTNVTWFRLLNDSGVVAGEFKTIPSSRQAQGAQAPEILTLKSGNAWATGVAFSPDGKQLVNGGNGGSDSIATAWDVASGREMFKVAGRFGGAWSVAYTPDGGQFLTGGDEGARLWDAKTGQLVQSYPPRGGSDWLESGPLRKPVERVSGRVEVVAFSPDGQRLLTGANGGQVIVWAVSGELLLKLARSGDSDVHAAAFSPDGLTIAVGSRDGKLVLWDSQSGLLTLTLAGHTNNIESLAYFPDGKRLVTASYDGTARVWDTKTGNQLLVFSGHRRIVTCVAVSPDGRYVATGGGIGPVRIWDSSTGRELLALKSVEASVDGVAFSSDGRLLAATSFDGVIRVWDVSALTTPPEQAISEPGSDVQLESDYIPIGMCLQRDPAARTIRSIRLAGKLPAQGGGAAEIWLDTRLAELNLFGDVVRRVGPEPLPARVELRYVSTGTGERTPSAMLHGNSQASQGFRAYDVVFPGGILASQLKLVLGTSNLGPHRLLVYDTVPASPRRPGQDPSYIVPLRGEPAIVSVLPDAPLRSPIHLTGYYTSVDGRVRRLRLDGTPSGAAKLQLDPNFISFDAFGEPVMSTAMGSKPHEITLNAAVGADPLGQGRKLYWAVSAEPLNTNRIAVVLSPTEAGEHRFLLYRGDEVAFIAPAFLADRRSLEAKASEFAGLPESERRALEELRKAIGYAFNCQTENGHASTLFLNLKAGSIPPASVLSRLPQLKMIEVNGGQFPAAFLADLLQLPNLLYLRFNTCEFRPDGFVVFENLTQVRSLAFAGCLGITDEAVGHLAGLTELKILNFSDEEILRRPPDPKRCITDAGVARLKNLVRLENLDLFGHDVSDASVPSLTSLKELQELALSGRGFTDAGLRGLASLPRLRHLRLFETSVSTNAVAGLKVEKPELQVEAWGRETH